MLTATTDSERQSSLQGMIVPRGPTTAIAAPRVGTSARETIVTSVTIMALEGAIRAAFACTTRTGVAVTAAGAGTITT